MSFVRFCNAGAGGISGISMRVMLQTGGQRRVMNKSTGVRRKNDD